MKRLSKVIVWLMIIVMSAWLVGCSNGGESSDTNKPGDSQTTDGDNVQRNGSAEDSSDPWEPKSDKTYEFTVVGVQFAPIAEDAPVKKWLEEKFNVKLNTPIVEQNGYEEKMNLKLGTGDIPDVFWANETTTLPNWVNQGVLVELPISKIQKYAPNLWKIYEKYIDKYDKDFWNYVNINGKNYGIEQIDEQTTWSSTMAWRDDWLKNVGINKIPETIQEAEMALYKFRNEDPDKNNKKDTYGMSLSVLNLTWGTSGYFPGTIGNSPNDGRGMWSVKDGQVVYGGIQPEVKNLLALYHKWYKDGVLDPEFITGENEGGYWANSNAFANGRIGTSAWGTWYHWAPPLYDGDKGSNNYQLFKQVQGENATYAVGHALIGADGKGGGGNQGIAQGTVMVFGKQLEKEPDKIARWLQFLDKVAFTDKETAWTAYFGIKGEHWEYDPVKGVVPTEKWTDKGLNTAVLGAHLSTTVLRSPEFAKLATPLSYDYGEKVASNPPIYKNAVRAVLPSNANWADLAKLQNETFIKIIVGDLDISAFDTFVNGWKAKGGDQLIKEANEYYNKLTGK